jgi:hypothetical protein
MTFAKAAAAWYTSGNVGGVIISISGIEDLLKSMYDRLCVEKVSVLVFAVSCSIWTRVIGRMNGCFRCLVVSSAGSIPIFPLTARGSSQQQGEQDIRYC